MIEVKGVTKTYGKRAAAFTALDDVNLTIPEGKTVAILGKSGSGKSTLMHAISGLDKPEKGQVLIDGVDILKLKRKKLDTFRAKTIGFIFQSFFVQANESCYDNVSLPLEVSNVSRGARKAKVRTALESVDLVEKINSKAKNLSGGQKQRLAIARAIVGEPKIIFADEPTGNLDSATSEKVEDLLFNYAHDRNATLIVVTHDEDLSKKCDIIIRIWDGKVESVTDTTQPHLQANPQVHPRQQMTTSEMPRRMSL